MIYIRIKSLIAAKKMQWGRKVTLSEIAEATGISRIRFVRGVEQRRLPT
jgi:DNA-binding GntR family transcriptional regulator